jgi:hypothetical protein
MVAPGSQRLDAVRIRVTLADRDVDAAALAYDLHGRPNRRQELYLCERPPQDEHMLLIDAGIIAEVRLDHSGSTSTTLKLRPCRPEQLNAFWSQFRHSTHHELRVEEDWVADRRVVAASLTHSDVPQHKQPSSPNVNHGRPPIPDTTAGFFSDRQRQFLRECRRGGLPTVEPLQLYGPMQVRSWLVKDRQFHVHLERWSHNTPRGSLDFLDISMLVIPEDAELVRPAFLASTRRRGIDPDAFSGSRTRRVLAHFLASS